MIEHLLALVSGFLKAVGEFFGWKKQADLLSAGRAEEKASQHEAALQIAKRQGEIMARERTVEDVSADLESGRF